MASVLINHKAGSFYCWRWCRWYRFRKFGYCCETGCRRMLVPSALRWRAEALGGLLVPAGRG